ncbi:MAG: hypothetical protein ABFC89_09070 [Methanospirillum sp.]
MVSLSPRSAGPALAALLLCLLACAPAFAHNATEMGVAPDQFDQGIPVYWPYHAALMTVGTIALLSGFVVMRYRLTGAWYKNHQRLQTFGSLAVVAGLAIGIYMVQLSQVTHLRELHGYLGAGTIAVILATLGLGFAIVRSPGIGKPARRVHRWLGGIAIALVALNIVLGIVMVPAILAQ